MMKLEAIEKVLAKIQRSLFKNSDYSAIGLLKSHFKGTGLSFREHQVYVHGDDVRFIDWKILARMDTPYIKTFEEERSVEIAIFIDLSESMLMGHKNISKMQAAVEITALLYMISQETSDNVTVFLMGEEIVNIPKTKGRPGLVQLVITLERMGILNEAGEFKHRKNRPERFNQEKMFKLLKGQIDRRKEVILISDFYDVLTEDQLKQILYKRNFHAIQLRSPVEEANQLPFTMLFKDYSNRKFLPKILIKKEAEPKTSIMNKRFKKISIDGEYLEKFVEEMLK